MKTVTSGAKGANMETTKVTTGTKADVITQFDALGDLLGIDLSEVVTDGYNKNHVAYAMAQVLVAELQERIK